MSTVNSNKECVEIQIPVPWGHISGKWWGPRNIRPILGLHGWQDNAGTFDTLAPLLSNQISFLAIDFPGHGTSSRLPDGIFYHSIDNIHVIRMIMKEYNWQTVSLIGHSMGSILCFQFAALYPDNIDLLIGLDALKPHIRPNHSIPKTISKRFTIFLIADERNRSKVEPPSYTYDECVQRVHMGTFKSVARDKCKYLLERSIVKSKNNPEKYYFVRDSRTKSYSYGTFSHELCLEMAQCIKTPFLFIKAKISPYYEAENYFHETVEVLKQNPKFQMYYADGTHHVHLNNPKEIAEIINDFVLKHRQLDNVFQAKL